MTAWKVIFFLEAADLTAVSPKFINLFYRHKLSSWSGLRGYSTIASALYQDNDCLISWQHRYQDLPRIARLRQNYISKRIQITKGKARKAVEHLTFNWLEIQRSWRPSCHHCSQTRVVFQASSYLELLTFFLEENVKIRMEGMWTSVWSSDFGNNVEKLPSDSRKSSNREFASNSLKEFPHLRVFQLWFCIMHDLGHGLNDTWLIW